MSVGVLIVLKYILCIILLIGILLFPSWLAAQNKKNKTDIGIVRLATWLFGWTGVGWLVGLWWAVK